MQPVVLRRVQRDALLPAVKRIVHRQAERRRPPINTVAVHPEVNTLRHHADFHQPACIAREDPTWIVSPQPGSAGVMLDRIGALPRGEHAQPVSGTAAAMPYAPGGPPALPSAGEPRA